MARDKVAGQKGAFLTEQEIAAKKANVKTIRAARIVDQVASMEAFVEDDELHAARAQFFKAQYDAFIDAGMSEAAAIAALGTIRFREA